MVQARAAVKENNRRFLPHAGTIGHEAGALDIKKESHTIYQCPHTRVLMPSLPPNGEAQRPRCEHREHPVRCSLWFGALGALCQYSSCPNALTPAAFRNHSPTSRYGPVRGDQRSTM